MNKPHVQIYILARDRVDFLRESINSAISQKTKSATFEIIISDNSTNNDVKILIENEFKNTVKYIKREKPSSSDIHFKKIIDEAIGDYVVLFHDDDKLNENYIEITINYFLLYKNASAIGCNANIIKNNEIQKSTTCNLSDIKHFKTERDILEMYLPSKWIGFAPFPSYMYRKNALKSEDFNPDHGGKYSDVSFLSKKTKYGEVIWIPEKLMNYRYHENNDSAFFSINEMRKLWLYMRSTGFDRNNKDLTSFRLQNWFFWLKKQNLITKTPLPVIPKTRKQAIVLHSLISNGFTKFYKLFYWRSIMGLIIFKLIKK